MKNIKYLCIAFLIIACNQDDANTNADEATLLIETLADLVAQNNVQIDNVIACASGSENPNETIAYVYPRPGASDLRYFETVDATVDKNDFELYTPVDIESEDFFNGFLRTFTVQSQEEKWVIISFQEDGDLHISNPIRLKHLTQNTILTDEVAIDQSQEAMPLFSWENITNQEDAIYFQVVSDENNDLLSGTYTFEDNFRYYELDNVVLNITQETPPELVIDDPYGFLLMGVSEDNWVNVLAQRTFVAQ